MARGLTDPIEEPQQNQGDAELDVVINELIKGQNKLHDRLVDLERKADHAANAAHSCKCNKRHEAESEAADRKFWKKGL